MTAFALPARLTAPRACSPEKLARTRRQTASFGDLVHAHWQWKHEHADDDARRERYEATRACFEAEHGKIVDDYWSTREPAAVAVCCLRTRWGREQWALHRSTARLAADHPEFARLLRDAARQSVRAANVLCGMTQRIATSNLFSLTRDVMASLEDEKVKPTGLDGVQERPAQHRGVRGPGGRAPGADRLPQGPDARAGRARRARAAARPGAVRARACDGVDPAVLAGCLVAGSFGATMSVLMRMSAGKFDVNHEIGREYVTNLGLARPYIGAIFALLLYFAVKGGLAPQIRPPSHDAAGQFAFFVAFGFLIGFSERFAKEIVRSAEAGPRGGTEGLGAEARRAGRRPSRAGHPGRRVAPPAPLPSGRRGDRARAPRRRARGRPGSRRGAAAPAPRRAPARRPARPPRRRAGARSAPPSAPAGAAGAPPARDRSGARAWRCTDERSPSGCRRSVRCLSSPGVCAPRSMSTHSTASSSSGSPSASSSRWRYLGARLPGPLARRAQRRRERRCSASRTIASSYSTTGSRLVAWLHARRRALRLRG